jgi:LysR family transcriptional regulator, regulator for bpeEF and oprC
MDKLRALEYFAAAAEEGSFTAAARRLHVSAMAVSKLIGSLEAQLAVPLFERHARGLTLTGDGAAYLQMCKPGMAQLAQADELLSASARDLRGTVVVGVQHIVAVRYLVPALPKFMLRYPDINIDLRDFTLANEEQTRGTDVFLRMGWVEAEGLVMRRLASMRFLICATPAYWNLHGTPKRPSDLREHNCLLFRNALGSTMDLWEFERGEERESVVVRGQLIAGNAHVYAAHEIALGGVGVCRGSDLDCANALEKRPVGASAERLAVDLSTTGHAVVSAECPTCASGAPLHRVRRGVVSSARSVARNSHRSRRAALLGQEGL